MNSNLNKFDNEHSIHIIKFKQDVGNFHDFGRFRAFNQHTVLYSNKPRQFNLLLAPYK